jgi:hypothetical protein
MADAQSPLYIRPDLSAIAIKYRQNNFIADEVMPRTLVEKQEFVHLADRIAEWITPPDTTVGRTSTPNALSNSSQDPTTYATVNQGLDEPVPNQDQQNGPSESALQRATQRVMSFVELRREIRVAGIVSTSGNYANSATLSGTSQWSDFTNSDPIQALLGYLDTPFMRPNTMVIGQDVWTKIRQHPKVISAVNYYGGGSGQGVASKEQIAAAMGIDQIIVGQGWYNTANKGQATTKARVWGKFCALLYLGQNGGPDSGNTWGYTAQFGQRIAGVRADANIGLFGGQWVRAGESVKEVVAAPEFGYLLSSVVG